MKAHSPAAYEKLDIYAVRACIAGEATPDQQRRAIDWIINRAANLYDMSYREDGEGGVTATAFHEGRRFVGNQIVKLTRPETLKALEIAAAKTHPKPSSREAKSDDQST